MIPGWKNEIEAEYLKFLMEKRKATPSEVAAGLGISESWAVYWLTELARDGRVRILGVGPVEEGESQLDEQPPQRPQRRASRPLAGAARALRDAA